MYNIQLFVARINVLPFSPNESASQISGAQGLERKSAWGEGGTFPAWKGPRGSQAGSGADEQRSGRNYVNHASVRN